MALEGSLRHLKQSVTCLILSQISPVQETQSSLLKIHFNIIFHLQLGLPSVSFPSGFPTRTKHATRLSHIQCCKPIPSHFSWCNQFYINTYRNPEKNQNRESNLFWSSTVVLFLTGFRNFSERREIMVNLGMISWNTVFWRLI
jgi:hypothetical protein